VAEITTATNKSICKSRARQCSASYLHASEVVPAKGFQFGY